MDVAVWWSSVKPQRHNFLMANALAERKMEPTLAKERILSSTATTGIFSLFLNSSAEGRFNSSILSLRIKSLRFGQVNRRKGNASMKQYKQIKAKHPGALLLFRVGISMKLSGGCC